VANYATLQLNSLVFNRLGMFLSGLVGGVLRVFFWAGLVGWCFANISGHVFNMS
jgi:hypothetical protein